MRMVVIFFLVPWHEVALGGGGWRLRTLLHRVLEQHVHEQIHRLGLDDQSPGRLLRAGVEVLVHAIVMHDRDIAGLPVVARAVVDFVARAIENVEGGLVHMAVLLSLCARGIFLEVKVQRLGAAVLGLHIMPAEMLRAAVELEVLALDHPRHRPQPGKLVLETVGPLQRAYEDAFFVRIVLLITHAYSSVTLSTTARSVRRIGDDIAVLFTPFRPHGYALGTLVASAEALPATIRYTRSPSVFSDSSLSPSFLRTTAARKARTVCGCQPVERVTVAMVAPLGPDSSASTRACFEFARPLG